LLKALLQRDAQRLRVSIPHAHRRYPCLLSIINSPLSNRISRALLAPPLEHTPIDCQDMVKVSLHLATLAAPQDVMVGAGDDGNRVDGT
jgi:hypothetical protein